VAVISICHSFLLRIGFSIISLKKYRSHSEDKKTKKRKKNKKEKKKTKKNTRVRKNSNQAAFTKPNPNAE
jgi:mannitol-specific phosphotransferase system IIBC component